MEKATASVNHTLVYTNCFIILFFLLATMYFTYTCIPRQGLSSVYQVIGCDTLLSSGITVGVLVVFQIYFYFMVGRKFTYPSTIETLELISHTM